MKALKSFYILILSVFLFLGLQEQVRLIINNSLLPIFSIERHWALDIALTIVIFVSVFLFYYYEKNNQNKKLISSLEIVVIFFLVICYGYYRWDESVYVFTRWWNSSIAYLDVFACFGLLYSIYRIIQCFYIKGKDGIVSISFPNILAPNQDAPLEEINQDKFGMQEQVNRVVNYLRIVDVSKKAFSIGVVGDWGYGKSSFFNFVKNEIKDTKDFIIMDFNPRSSKDIHCIQEDFLNGLRDVLMSFHPNLTRLFEDYAQALNISTNSSPIMSFLLRLFKLHTKSWKESYDNIDTIIKDVNRRIVVFVDDLDRLTAKELLEVLKVIDKNGAFNHVIFLSAYDKEYVNNALKAYLRHDVKCPYTDKYFDLEIKLPKHAFHLLMDYLQDILQEACLAKQIKLSQEKVKESIQDVEECLRKRLHTIRDVKRLTNQFLYNYPIVQTEVKFHDYFLLELIKFSHKEEYDKLRDAEYVEIARSAKRNMNIYCLLPSLYQLENRHKTCSIDVLEKLFPTKVNSNFDSGPGRICNTNSFDIYFYNNEYDHLLQNDFDSLYTTSLEESCKSIDLWLSNTQEKSPHEADVLNYMTSRNLTSRGDVDHLKTYFQLLLYLYSKCEASGYWVKLRAFFQKEEGEKNVTYYRFEDKTVYLNWMKDAMIELFALKKDISIYILPKIMDDMQKSQKFSDSLLFTFQELQLIALSFFESYLRKMENSDWDAKMALILSAIQGNDDEHFFEPSMKCLRTAVENKPEKFYSVFLPVIINDKSENSNLKFVSFDPNFHLLEVFPNPNDFQNLLENHKTYNYKDLDVIQKFYRLYMRNDFHRFALETSSNTVEGIVDEVYQKLLKLEVLNSNLELKNEWKKIKRLRDVEECQQKYNSFKTDVDNLDLDIEYKKIVSQNIQSCLTRLKERYKEMCAFSNEMVVGDFVKVKDEFLPVYQDQKSTKLRKNICKIMEILPEGKLVLKTYDGVIPTSAVEAIRIDRIADNGLYYDPMMEESIFNSSVINYYMDCFKNYYDDEGKCYHEIVEEYKFEFVHQVQHWLRKERNQDLKLNWIYLAPNQKDSLLRVSKAW